jgi:hypothetical protein
MGHGRIISHGHRISTPDQCKKKALPEEKHRMKRILMCTGLLFAATTLLAQQPPAKKPPLSPPATATAAVNGKTITITYSSPRVKGREGKIYTSDGLISHDPHYPVWRAGANAATTLTTDSDLMIGNLTVPAGTYTLFVDISDPAHWVLIVSKATGEWGLAYDPTKDLGKTPMTMSKPPAMVEDLTYTLNIDNGNGTLTLAWEDVNASVNVMVH